MSGQYKHPCFHTLPLFWKCYSLHVLHRAYSLNPQLLTGFPSEQSHPKKTNSAFEKHLNGSGPCLKLYLLLVFSYLHGIVCWKKDKFTLDILKQARFSGGKARQFLTSKPPKSDVPPEYSPRPGFLFQAEYWGQQSISWLSICLWQRKHQADTSQSGISCFPAFDLLS